MQMIYKTCSYVEYQASRKYFITFSKVHKYVDYPYNT